MKPVFWCAGAFALVGTLGWQSASVAAITNPPVRIAGLDAHDSSASASLLGQFRTNISAWLWVHADLYLHNGVHMRPITEGELKAGVSVEDAAKDGNEKLHEESLVTVVPPANRDFRGIFGDVERSISSWQDMHQHAHNDPEQCLPMYRLMTWLDPQFIEGWTTGAMVVARDRSPGGTSRAMEFLNEGLRANPDSVDLMTELGYMIYTRRKSPLEAIPWLEKARGLGFDHRDTLPENERSALENTYRWLALCYRDTDQPSEERRVTTEGLKVFSDDKVLDSLLRHVGEKGRNGAELAEGLRTGN